MASSVAYKFQEKFNFLTNPSHHNAGVYYSLLFKLWQSAAGLITIAFIAYFMDAEAQGYYYAFASLIALQSFFELGLYFVVSIAASHEWARLNLTPEGQIDGDPEALSHLISLGRFVFQWYGMAALIFLLLAGGLGLHFFTEPRPVSFEWRAQWLLHVTFSAGNLWLLPFLSLLEGCNQFASTARFRLIQSLASSAAAWAIMAAGGQLWALPALSGVSLVLILGYIIFTKRNFFSAFYRRPKGSKLNWQRDLLPMQWRLAIQGLFSYLSFPLYPALIFAAVGSEEAGRLGMTLQIVNAIQSLGIVLISTRAPALAMAVAQGQRETLRATWVSASLQAVLMMTTLSIAFLAVLIFVVTVGWPPAQRVLSGSIITLFLLGAFMALIVQCIAIYLRAHRVERLTLVGVVSGACYGITAWALAPIYGSWGMAWSYLIVTTFIALPLAVIIYFRVRQEETQP